MILWYFYLFSMVLLFDPTKNGQRYFKYLWYFYWFSGLCPAVLLLPAVLLFDSSEYLLSKVECSGIFWLEQDKMRNFCRHWAVIQSYSCYNFSPLFNQLPPLLSWWAVKTAPSMPSAVWEEVKRRRAEAEAEKARVEEEEREAERRENEKKERKELQKQRKLQVSQGFKETFQKN